MYHTKDEIGYIEKNCICCNCQFLTLFLTPQHYINWTAYFALRDRTTSYAWRLETTYTQVVMFLHAEILYYGCP